MSIGSIKLCLAISMALSAVPPTPIPIIPGGHQPAPIVGIVFNTHSSRLSLGFRMVNFALFSEPAPFAATVKLNLFPGTTEV